MIYRTFNLFPQLTTFCYLFILPRYGPLNIDTSKEERKRFRYTMQVFVALVYQVAAPTIFIQLPSFIVLTIPFLDLKFSFRGSIIIYGYCTYPLVDFLIILKVITEYRNAYKRFLKKLAYRFIEMLGCNIQTTTVAPSTTVSRTLART
ncbi:hypothetical protein CRE_11162 [Caenorhabditis remanei]|uniref:7TM GPCR serpentine receptor class x (Srx) domain-containing protein n=1 Tax=Caenorhabditis remanei TaxID=31234 RepID=E3MQ31_CAERE|nr:hypothetical protein CRE_11162 [Caenorhabditis remanei]